MDKNNVAVGVDIGGTNIRAGLVTEDGKILKIISEKTPKKKKEILEKIHEMIKSVIVEDISCIGIGIAGPINNSTGIIYPPNIKELDKVNIVKEMNLYNVPVIVENDGNCFSFAEFKVGAGIKYENILGITLGTGIGCGIIINGKIYSGRDGAAGEIGHIVIDLNAKSVGRGIPGSFENLASGTAISRRAKEDGLDKTSMQELVVSNDIKAKKIVAETGTYIGIGLASLINIFNPDIIVLGGSVANSLKYFKNEMNKEISSRAIMPSKKVKIVISKLEEPGVVGAGIIALER